MAEQTLPYDWFSVLQRVQSKQIGSRTDYFQQLNERSRQVCEVIVSEAATSFSSRVLIVICLLARAVLLALTLVKKPSHLGASL